MYIVCPLLPVYLDCPSSSRLSQVTTSIENQKQQNDTMNGNILFVVSFVFVIFVMCIMCQLLPVYLDCPFLVVSFVFVIFVMYIVCPLLPVYLDCPLLPVYLDCPFLVVSFVLYTGNN
jgi:uncharacterized membrane protein